MAMKLSREQIDAHRRSRPNDFSGLHDSEVECLLLHLEDASTEALVCELRNRRWKVWLE